MARTSSFLGFIFAFAVAFAPVKAQTMRNMSILTGGPSGTYYRFGQDIAQVVEQECRVSMEVKQSQGSLDNLNRLRHEPFTQLAIVQSDALEFLKLQAENDRESRDKLENYRYVYALYPEEVHIVARKDSGIRTITDLAGRRVAIGKPRSGTLLTATLLLNQTGIDVRNPNANINVSRIGGKAALDRLLSSNDAERIDAMFYVAGKPVALFDGGDPRLRDLTLVSIDDPRIDRWGKYLSAEFKAGDYPWLDHNVKTVAVRSALVSFDFRGESCENVGMVALLIKNDIEDLRRRFGHSKWNQLDLDTPVLGWKRYECVTTALTKRVISRPGQRCAFAECKGPNCCTGPHCKPQSPSCTGPNCREDCLKACGSDALCKMLCPTQ